MAGHNHVYGICENKCLVETMSKEQIEAIVPSGHSKAFTYEVNSDASLAYWLSNKQSGTSSGGDDFTSVLIRKGEWNYTGNTEALDDIGTLYVEGEAGSLLKFTNTRKGLWYNSINPESSMFNVNIELSSITYDGCVYGFLNCSNLTNCTSNSTSISTSTVVATNSHGFHGCSNLINCTSTGIAAVGIGFHGCSNLIDCTGTGIAAVGVVGSGWGFEWCNVVHRCKAGGHCTTSVFDNRCYASHTETSDYACADTANGGFNDTTNPAAT